ncbi:MAG: type II secretion system protein [Bacillota bacterium]
MKIIQNNHGFTLIEMTMVLVIIGILLSISIPGLAGIREQAEATAVQLELSGIKTLLEIYYLENDHKYPPQAEFTTLDIEKSENFFYETNTERTSYKVITTNAYGGNYYYIEDTKTNIQRTSTSTL